MTHPNKWRNKLLVAIPCAELAYAQFWQRLLTLRHIGWHIDNGMVMTTGSAYIQDAHNKVVADALTIPGWDRLCFIEHDHVFSHDVLERMAQWTEPVVSGLYFSRNVEAPQPVLYNWREQRMGISPLQPYEMAPLLEKPGLHKVDVVPMGCTSIRRDVLEKWPLDIPYFAVATGKGRTQGIMGDDVWFCRHAQDQGHSIYVDSSMQVAHLGLVPFNASVYTAWVSKLKREGKTGTLEAYKTSTEG